MTDLPSTHPDEPRLHALLAELGIAYHTEEHEAVFTVEEGREEGVEGSRLPGGHSKNLFLKDKAGAVRP